MSAAGRVRVGFSKPYVALYKATGETVSYSGGMRLARGVSVSLEPEYSDDNPWHADNEEAETEGGDFNGGTVTLTCDDPLPEAKKTIEGTSDAADDGWVDYGTSLKRPFVGLGWLVEYVSGGVHSWVPTIACKAKLASISDEAATREDGIEYQTSEQQYSLFRDDTSKHNWKRVNEAGFSTEAEAETALKKALGITTTA